MKKIPEIQSPEIWRCSDFQHEELVEIRDSRQFSVCMQYPLLGMKNAEERCFVRRETALRLSRAAELLPAGYRLKILDAWRPFALQAELFDVYSEKIIRDFTLADLPEDERNAFIARFVSHPVEDRDIPPVHTTGGAVDLTIIDENGTDLPMGTAFDDFTEKTDTAWFEKGGDTAVRDNRRLLYHVMTEAGFTNLPSEWWHFDYGDRFWAYYTKSPTLYRGVFRREEFDEEK